MKKLRPLRFLRKVLQLNTPTETPRVESCRSCQCGLEKVGEEDGAVLRCPDCHGIWLSAASLTLSLSKLRPEQELSCLMEEETDVEIGHAFAPSRIKRECPQCGRAMENHKFEDSGVWIDSCAEGHGIWLDRGELKLLRERRNYQPSSEGTSDIDTVSELLLDFL